MTRQRSSSGFTLIELMVVVLIIGVLAAVAVPTLSRYLRRAKNIEAVAGVKKLYDAARTYYAEEFSARGTGAPVPKQFPASTGPTPAENQCCTDGGKCKPSSAQWQDPTWVALRFSIDDPHSYWYTFTSDGANLDAKFTVAGNGNLDCDKVYSTFEARGAVNVEGEVMGTGQVYREKETE